MRSRSSPTPSRSTFRLATLFASTAGSSNVLVVVGRRDPGLGRRSRSRHRGRALSADAGAVAGTDTGGCGRRHLSRNIQCDVDLLRLPESGPRSRGIVFASGACQAGERRARGPEQLGRHRDGGREGSRESRRASRRTLEPSRARMPAAGSDADCRRPRASRRRRWPAPPGGRRSRRTTRCRRIPGPPATVRRSPGPTGRHPDSAAGR